MDELKELVKECGVELYDTEITNENSRAIFRVYITKEGGVKLEDCEKVSRMLSPIFDVNPPVSGDYHLEVSSPGLERKLEKLLHFVSSLGELVKIKYEDKVIKGRLVKADENFIAIQNEDGLFEVKFTDIKRAKTYLEW